MLCICEKTISNNMDSMSKICVIVAKANGPLISQEERKLSCQF